MTKKELVYLHMLFDEVAEYMDVERESYSETDTTPLSVHRSMDDHQDGIWKLLEDIQREIDGETYPEDVDQIENWLE